MTNFAPNLSPDTLLILPIIVVLIACILVIIGLAGMFETAVLVTWYTSADKFNSRMLRYAATSIVGIIILGLATGYVFYVYF